MSTIAGARVLVTGAFGTLGRAVIRNALARGVRVRCFDLRTLRNRRAARGLDDRIEVMWGDIRDPTCVAAAVAGQDAVIHDAALLPPVTERHPDLARSVNVGGTRNLLEALAALPTPPPIVFPSSVTVFGPDSTRRRPLRVEDPVHATDEYTKHKLVAETLVRAAAVPSVILRVGASVDPATRSGDLDALSTLFTMSPESRLEWVHPDDVARAQLNAIARREAWGHVWLVGGGPTCQVLLRDLVDTLFLALGLGPTPTAAFGNRTFYTDWMDTADSERVLRYQRYSFAEFRRALASNLRTLRRALAPVRPLARAWLLRRSPSWRQRRASSPGRARPSSGLP